MRNEQGFIQGPQLVILAICGVVIVVGGAILLIDKYIVRPNRPPIDVEGHLSQFGFEPVPEEERVEQARRLLRGVPGFTDRELEERGVQRMVRRVADAGTVWAFELTMEGEWGIRNARTLQRHEAKLEMLQPVIVVEQPSVDQGRWVVAPGEVPEELRPGLRPVRLAVPGLAGGMSEDDPFVGLERVDALARMRSWVDIWFAGNEQRTVFFWPPPRASMLYWASRSTSDELVPSLANGGFEWDLQRAVDISGMLHPDAPELEKVIRIDVEVPDIELPELDLTSGFAQEQEKLRKKIEESNAQFDEALEEFRANSAAQRQELQRKMEERSEQNRQRMEEMRLQQEADRATRREESQRRLEESRKRSEELLEEIRQRTEEVTESSPSDPPPR